MSSKVLHRERVSWYYFPIMINKDFQNTILWRCEMKIFVEQYRMEKNLTLSELARKSGVAKSHISNIESGDKNPTILTLCKLAKALEVPCYKLFACD